MEIAEKYEVPDKCPDDCSLMGDMKSYGQNSLCFRCPVFNCSGEARERLLKPEEYREDWAKEWVKFFSGEVKEPILSYGYNP